MNTPKVSVIIATHNRKEFLKDTVDSVLSQTFKDFELIIINDGSADGTEELIKAYTDKRIKYFYQKKQGQNGAKNAGLIKAQGEYISILDSDDIWLPTKLEKQVNILDQHHEIGLVYSGTLVIDENNNVTGKKPLLSYNGNVLDKLLMTNFIYNGSNALYRKDCILKAGIFDPEIPSMTDWGLYLKFAVHYKFYCVEEYLLKYRIHKENMSCDFKKYEKSGFIILDKIFNIKELDKKYFELKNRAYAFRYRYMGRRYFESGLNKESRNYLLKALELDWKLLFQTDVFLLLLASLAPVKVVNNLRALNKKMKLPVAGSSN